MTFSKLARAPYAPLVALVAVTGFWVFSQRLVVGLHLPLGVDESVYASQASSRPHMPWTAPRAYGLPMLLWPVVHFTSSTVALRIWVRVLAAWALVLAYLPWLRVRPWSAVVGAGLFCSLWLPTFYATQAMPNIFTGLAALSGVGWTALSLGQSRVSYRVGVVVAFGVMSLVRPSDAMFGILAMLLVVVLARSVPWARRFKAGLAALIGLGIGWSFWVAESVANFGGPLKRLHDASVQDGGLRWNLSFLSSSASGPVGCCHDLGLSSATSWWWWAVWPLALLGVYLARGKGRLAYLLCAASAAGIFVQYLILIQVQAPGPRVLLPVYALLSVPVGQALVSLVRRARPGLTRWLVGGTIAVLVVANGHAQLHVLRVNVAEQRSIRNAGPRLTETLKASGIKPPCILTGPRLEIEAYAIGCHERPGVPDAALEARARSTGTRLSAILLTARDIHNLESRYTHALPGYRLTRIPTAGGHQILIYTYVPSQP